jgi:hypothetical protein
MQARLNLTEQGWEREQVDRTWQRHRKNAVALPWAVATVAESTVTTHKVLPVHSARLQDSGWKADPI